VKDNGKRCKVKVSCLQENLARGLTIVGRAVAARSTLPVVSNVLLNLDGVLERYPLFDPALQGYFWDWNNQGMKLVQLRFYPIASVVPAP